MHLAGGEYSTYQTHYRNSPIQTSVDVPPNDLGEFGLLLLLFGDKGHVIQEGIHLCKCKGAGLARGHERALLKECLGCLSHISLAE